MKDFPPRSELASRMLVSCLGLVALGVGLVACEPGDGDTDEASTSAESDPVTEEGAVEDQASIAVGILQVHNDARASADPAPTPALAPLQWDEELAAVAQRYADGCKYGHSMGEYGENLFAQAGKEATAEEAASAWAAEADDYDYDTGACSGKCGHYTQMVWRDTARVGCGVALCTTGSPFQGFTTWQYWVCNYDPSGNWQGEKPY